MGGRDLLWDADLVAGGTRVFCDVGLVAGGGDAEPAAGVRTGSGRAVRIVARAAAPDAAAAAVRVCVCCGFHYAVIGPKRHLGAIITMRL